MGQAVFKFDVCRCASAGGKQLAPTAVTACKSPNVAVLMFKINTSYIKKSVHCPQCLKKRQVSSISRRYGAGMLADRFIYPV